MVSTASTHGLGPCSLGSNPSAPTKNKASSLKASLIFDGVFKISKLGFEGRERVERPGSIRSVSYGSRIMNCGIVNDM